MKAVRWKWLLRGDVKWPMKMQEEPCLSKKIVAWTFYRMSHAFLLDSIDMFFKKIDLQSNLNQTELLCHQGDDFCHQPTLALASPPPPEMHF